MGRVPKRWVLPGILVLVTFGGILGGVLWAVSARFRTGVRQPIAFNHNLHISQVGLECSHCHIGVEASAFATLPKAEVCLTCHAAPLSESTEEAKVRDYGDEKGEIPWRRLTRMPDHVYFSHQRHVTFGKVACEACHGKMQERTKPPSVAPRDLSMDDCLECHQKQGASVDCVGCHR